jgi:hypothetical protein
MEQVLMGIEYINEFIRFIIQKIILNKKDTAHPLVEQSCVFLL